MANSPDDEDDEDCYKGLFENGHWEWNDSEGGLKFFSNEPSTTESETQLPVALGPIEFRDDLDLIEQQRFRKWYQRKFVVEDVVTLQDIKDFVLYTAPKSLLTVSLVNVLHLPMTERFIRSLITYCQYFIQVSEEMSRRMSQLQSKIRTQTSDAIENTYRNNLEDLRLLVAAQYCSIIMGAGSFAKYHHMGPLKKSNTQTKKDKILFESILHISTQIVWLALGRKMYNQIEMEVHRLFKTDIYNVIEHQLTYNYRDDLDERELSVLVGQCVRQPRMLTAYSPAMTSVNCMRDFDYRIMGLGVTHYNNLTPRLRYMERVLIAPEEVLKDRNVSLGILGMPRVRFDTTLKEIKTTPVISSSTFSVASARRSTPQGKSIPAKQTGASASSAKSGNVPLPLYPDMYIPDEEDVTECLPDVFPESDLRQISCSEIQRNKWLRHVLHLNMLHKKKAKGRVRIAVQNVPN